MKVWLATREDFTRYGRDSLRDGNAYYERADLRGVTFHMLRHTFASHAVTNDVDLYTLAKLWDTATSVWCNDMHICPLLTCELPQSKPLRQCLQ